MKSKLLLACTILFANCAEAQVGIGVTQPRMKLDVSAPDSAVLLLENNTTQATGTKTGLYLRSGNRYMGGLAARGTSSGDASLGFYTYSTNLVSDLKERMTILDDGKVGINVINPTARLDVDGTLRFRTGAGAGKVLTSDATGNATWANPTTSASNTGFSTSISSSQSFLSSGGEVLMNFVDNANSNYTFDAGSNFNNTNHEYTVPQTGMYHFDIEAEVDISSTNNSQMNMYIKRNGTTIKNLYNLVPNSSYRTVMNSSFNVNLTAGDVISVYFRNWASTSAADVSSGPLTTFFSGYLVY